MFILLDIVATVVVVAFASNVIIVVLCFSLQDEGTFSLNKNAREALEALGSRLASKSIGTYITDAGVGSLV